MADTQKPVTPLTALLSVQSYVGPTGLAILLVGLTGIAVYGVAYYASHRS